MTVRKSFLRRFAAGAGTLALATTGMLAMGPAAGASPIVGPDQPGAEGEGGKLTIHKYVGAEGDAGNGYELDTPPAGEALEGAEFTIWRLGTLDGETCDPIDLRDTNDWSLLPYADNDAGSDFASAPADLAGVEAAGFCAVQVGQDTTNADGELPFTFTNDQLGLYYVQETDAPANIVSKTAPFYVTVPLPTGEANNYAWNYDVHVYPKNQELDGPEKTINSDEAQEGLTVGSTVEWTITQTVPALNDGETYESANIWDELSDGLTFGETVSVTIGETDVDFNRTQEDNRVNWEITDPNDQLNEGDVIEIVFTTTVTKVTEDGSIANLKNQYGSEFNGGTTPGTTDPYTYWGDLEILKVDEGNKPLAEAIFEVYEADEDNECAPTPPSGDPVSTGTSGENGIVLWDFTEPASSPLGLFVANSPDGPLPNPSKTYCVYETQAPAGYVGAGVKTVDVKAGEGVTEQVTFTNVQKDRPDLPLTGAQGTFWMTVGGLFIIAAGAAAIIVARRRKANNAA